MRWSDSRRRWSSNEDDPSPRELREMRERERLSDDYYDEDEPIKKAPLLYRLLAWAALIAIFFAVGYGATSLVFRWMDGKGGTRTPDNLAASAPEAAQVIDRALSADAAQRSSVNTVTCTLFIPDAGAFVSRKIQCPAGLKEDTMKGAIAAYIDALKENSMLDSSVQMLNLFQSGDSLYLNMNGKFFDSLGALGAEGSRYLITGLVRTMSDNFAPVTKVKFFIDGREAPSKKPVDLSEAWSI